MNDTTTPVSAPPPAPISAVDMAALNRRAALASMSVATLLLGMKIWATISTGSAAMLGSLADTALDLVASVSTLLGVSIAAIPDDAGHRFGHGKAEALAAMFQVVLISLSAFGLALRSIQQFFGHGPVEDPGSGILVSVIAIAATFALVAYQRHVIRKTQSLAISTDHFHYLSDLVLNLAVIVALVLDHWARIPGVDEIFGLAIAVWLGRGAWEASQQAIEQLMDSEWPLEKRERFLAAIPHHPALKGIHDFRTRTSGRRDFAQFHIWVDGRMSVAAAHKVMDMIEDGLHKEFPEVEILIHTDPEGLVDEGPLGSNDVLPHEEQDISPALLVQGRPR